MHHYLYPKWMKFKEVHAALQKDILKEQRSMNAKEDSISQKKKITIYLKRSFRLVFSLEEVTNDGEDLMKLTRLAL